MTLETFSRSSVSDSDPYLFCTDPGTDPDTDPSINKQETMKSLISAVKWLPKNVLSLKTDENIPAESNKQNKTKIKLIFCWHLGSRWRKEQGPDLNLNRIRIGSENSVHGSKDPNPYQYRYRVCHGSGTLPRRVNSWKLGTACQTTSGLKQGRKHSQRLKQERA